VRYLDRFQLLSEKVILFVDILIRLNSDLRVLGSLVRVVKSFDNSQLCGAVVIFNQLAHGYDNSRNPFVSPIVLHYNRRLIKISILWTNFNIFL
jgi:hypothetical protein